MMRTVILISLMAATLLTNLYAKEDSLSVTKFLKHALEKNPTVSNITVELKDSKKVEGLDGWTAQNIAIHAVIKDGTKNGKEVRETTTYFTDGRFIANSLTDMKTGNKITLEQRFSDSFYKKENLISGSNNSKHKIVIFSDPLCPFCIKNVPKYIRAVKKHPDLFAVYYYDLPLEALHPASVTIVKINEALRISNKKSSILDLIFEMYDFEIASNEKNEDTILKAYNEQFGYKLTKEQINTKEVLSKTKNSKDIAIKQGVNGTPTFYFDGNKDNGSIYKQFLK